MRRNTAATAVRSGSSASVVDCTSVPSAAQAAPARKNPTSAARGSSVTRPEASAV